MQTTLDLGTTSIEVDADAAPQSTAAGWIVRARDVVLAHPLGATGFYRHGWHSWSPTRWVSLDRSPRSSPYGGAQSDDPPLLDTDVHTGCWVGALHTGPGQVLLLGSLGLEARVEADPHELRGRGSEDGWFLAHGDELAVFDAYAHELATRFGARPGLPGRVWCSWYSFYADISESRLDDVLTGIDGLAFDVFQVDDGWQQHIGDWHPNDRFPSGMAALAGRIADAGFRPGLWLAPFIGHAESRLFRDHPDLFLTDDEGAPVVAGDNWGGPYHALDVTRPEARDALWQIIRRATEWGFTYLKLDFLFAAGLPGVRADGTGREAAYRLAAETVRDAAGDDCYLLACGAPIVPSLGVFDGLRVGPDVAPWWELDMVPDELRSLAAPATRYAISTSLHRLWLRNVIAVDPDVVYFRTKHCLLDPPQRGYLQDLAQICDFVATSDPPAWLDEDERAALGLYLATTSKADRFDRYRFNIEGREVDFRPVVLDDPETLA